MSAAPPTQPDLKSTLEEMRASAAEASHGGLTRAIEQAFLRILGMLLAMLEDFRAGRLGCMAAAEEVIARRSEGVHAGSRGASEAHDHVDVRAGGPDRRVTPRENSDACGTFPHAGEDAAPGEYRSPSCAPGPGNCPPPSRIGPHFDRQKCEPVVARSRRRARPGMDARGFRRAVPPSGARPAASKRLFFKNADLGKGISASMSFQRQNDAPAA